MVAIGRQRIAIIVLLWIGVVSAQAKEVPHLYARVNDYGNVLSDDRTHAVESLLQSHEDATSNQIVVLTVSSLDGERLEAYAITVFNTWGLGQDDLDNGVLVLLALNDRKVRIEVGYGLEPILTDVAARRIITEIMIPYFRDGNYESGLHEGVKAIINVLDGHTVDRSVQGSSVRRAVDRYHKLILFLCLVISILAGIGLYRRYRRNRPRTSGKSGLPMWRLPENEEDKHLQKGQRIEETIGSVDYDVWVSDEASDVEIIAYRNYWNWKYRVCEKCDHRAYYKVRSYVKVHATYSSSGHGYREYKCKVCKCEKKERYSIAKLQRSSSSGGFSSGGGGRSSGGFSGGGGSSGGGGASGSW